jgi:hypothetical protein
MEAIMSIRISITGVALAAFGLIAFASAVFAQESYAKDISTSHRSHDNKGLIVIAHPGASGYRPLEIPSTAAHRTADEHRCG